MIPCNSESLSPYGLCFFNSDVDRVSHFGVLFHVLEDGMFVFHFVCNGKTILWYLPQNACKLVENKACVTNTIIGAFGCDAMELCGLWRDLILSIASLDNS